VDRSGLVYSSEEVSMQSVVTRSLCSILLRVSSLDVRDESEIDWNTLRGTDLDNWSAHILQRRWTKLKAAITDFEDKSHEGQSDFVITWPGHYLRVLTDIVFTLLQKLEIPT
jgi:hypothetical protein